MNGLESRIKGLEEHIEKLYKTIEGWEKLARDKDEIIKKYEQQVKKLAIHNVSQQRELLIAYHKHNTMIRNEELDKFIENYVDDYLSNL